MKNLFLLLIITVFYSCKKTDECADCVRTWTITTHDEYFGQIINQKDSATATETFEACGKTEISNEEKTKTIVTRRLKNGANPEWYVVTETGVCSCTMK
jgi:hypothetical protein